MKVLIFNRVCHHDGTEINFQSRDVSQMCFNFPLFIIEWVSAFDYSELILVMGPEDGFRGVLECARSRRWCLRGDWYLEGD